MALSYVGGTSGSGTGASYTISLSGTLTGGSGSSPQQGDIVVVWTAFSQNTTAQAPTVSGDNSGSYTAAGSAIHANDTFDIEAGMFYFVQGSSVDTQLTIGRRSNAAYGGATTVHVWRGIDASNPLDATGTPASGTNSSRANPPSVTPSTTGAIVVYGGAGSQGTSGVTPTDGNSGDNVVALNSDGTTSDVGVYMASKTWTSGALDPAANTDMTTSTSCAWGAQTIALRPILDRSINVSDTCAVTDFNKIANDTYSADFNGTSAKLTRADNATLSFTGSFTIEGWMKMDTLPSSGLDYKFVDKWNTSLANRGYQVYIQNSAGTMNMSMALSSTGSDSNAWSQNYAFTTGVWYHVAWVYTSGGSPKIEFYVNGVLQGTATSGVYSSVNDSPATLTIGAYTDSGGSGSWFDGLIDDVRLWNTAKSGADILANIDNELTGSESNLVAYWQLDNALTDETANAFTLTNANVTFSTTTPDVTPSITISIQSSVNVSDSSTAAESTTASVTTPPIVTLNTPADASTLANNTPDLKFTGTDVESNDIRYQVQIDTQSGFGSTIVPYGNYSTSLSGSYTTLGNDAAFQKHAGIHFTTTAYRAVIDLVAFPIQKVSSPPGNAYVDIYSSTGTPGTNAQPTGSVLATSDPVSASTFAVTPPTDASGYYNFSFSGTNRIELSPSTTYYAVLRYENGDASNYIRVYIVSPLTSSYNGAVSTDALSWTTSTGYDYGCSVEAKRPTLDVISGTDAGFSGTPDNTDPFTSGQEVTYTVQSGLSSGTKYWRVRGKDPSGSNTYGAWSSTRSFTVPVALTISVSDSTTAVDELASADYYFDASDNAVSDPNTVWTDDANAFDGSTATFASTTTSGATNYLFAGGTNAPGSGDAIAFIEATGYGFANGLAVIECDIYTDGKGENLGFVAVPGSDTPLWSDPTQLTTPTGGWTWAKVQALEAECYLSATATSAQLHYLNLRVVTGIYVSEPAVGDFSISVSDSSTIAEAVTIENTQLGDVSVSDASTIAESIIAIISLGINVSDASTIAESVTTIIDLAISVSDASTIAEAVTIANTQLGDVSVSDASTIAEATTIENTQLGDASVFDASTIAETITAVSEYGPLDISVSDSSTIAESITIANTQLGNVSVSDASTIAEAVTIANTQLGDVSVSDASTIVEAVTIENTQLGDVSVSDASTIAEDVTAIISLGINVSDASTIAEAVTIENTQLGDVSVSDVSTIAESVTAIIDLAISVSDASTIAEDVTAIISLGINVSDASTIAEAVTITNTQLGDMSVFDASTIAEAVTITNTQLGDVSVSDASTIAEAITIENTQLGDVSVSDTSTIAEAITIENTQLGDVSVSDASTIAESVTAIIDLAISVSDASTISEAVTIENTQLGDVSVSDASTTTESITASISSPGAFSIFVTDSITILDGVEDSGEIIIITEDVNVVISLTINVSDSSTIAEAVTIENTQLGDVSVSDSSTATESVTITSQLGDISASDSITIIDGVEDSPETITIEEDVNIQANLGDISVSDSISISESTTVSVGSPGVLDVSVSDSSTIVDEIGYRAIIDSVSIAENVTIETFIGDLLVSVSDSTSIAEVVTISNTQLGDVSVSDSSTATESVTITNTTLGAVSVSDSSTIVDEIGYRAIIDSVSIAESIIVSVADPGAFSAVVTDASTIAEAVTIENTQLGDVSVSDASTIAESVAAIISLGINVSDSSTTTESVTAVISLAISVSDASTITEAVTIENTQLGDVSVSDASTMAESVTATTSLAISVSDASTITEAVTIENTQLGDVSVSDASTIAESIIVSVGEPGAFSIVVTDSSTTSEAVTIENTQLGDVSVSDASTVAESVTAVISLAASVSDASTIAEAVTITNTQLGDVSASDASTIAEAVTIENTQLGNISISDASTITESVTIEISAVIHEISVSDSSATAEGVTIENVQLGDVSVSDNTSATEQISIEAVFGIIDITISDASTITESVSVTNTECESSVSDSSTISENISSVASIDLSVSDSITISESVESAFVSVISISDASTITDAVTLTGEIFIAVSDETTPAEAITAEATLADITCSDIIAITELVGPVFVSLVDVYDSSTIGESITSSTIRYSPGRRVHGRGTTHNQNYGRAGSGRSRF